MNKLANSNLETSWEDHPIFKFLIENRKAIYVSVALFLVALLAIFKWDSGRSSNAASDYLTADNTFLAFAKEEENKEQYQELEALLKKHPELHAKYDGLIAQTFLNRNEVNSAMPYAGRALKRTLTENEPYYTKYSAVTLLIGERKYLDALQQTVALHKELTKSDSDHQYFGESLFMFNFLRIAMLQKTLGLKKEELVTWQEWQKMENKSESFAQQVQHFSEGKMILSEYIEARIELLNKEIKA